MREMDEHGAQSGRLLQGIAEQAKEESEKILKDAERQAKEIVEGARKKARTIQQEALERLEKQAEGVARRYRQLSETEQRKVRLQVQEELFSMSLEKIRKYLSSLRKRSDYEKILKGWIVEGALGLERDRVYVNAPREERSFLDGKILSECESEILEHSGRTVKLELSPEAPTSGQGVFLSAADGKIAFNNEVDARMQRSSAEIRRMIYRRIQNGQQEK